MAATTLSAMPSAVYAGDTLLLLLGFGDYPADESWTLTFDFRKKDGSLITFSSTASGASHAITVAKDDTGVWIPGTYAGVAYVDDGSQRFTVWRGQLEVLPNLAIEDANYDARSHAQKCLDAINLVLEGKASRDVLNTTIAGQSVGRMSFRELLEAKAYYESIVANELAELGQSSNQILGRFNRP